MKRNELREKLGLGASGVVLPTGLARVKNEPVRVYDGYVHSIMHYGFSDLKDRMNAGDELSLERDLDNDYDHHAVCVSWNGVKVGYLPMYENIVIANLLDSGVSLKAYIGKIDQSVSPRNALSIIVFTNLVISLPPVSSRFTVQKKPNYSRAAV